MVTPHQNSLNISKYKNATSKYKGVCFDKKRNKWLSYISIDKKQKILGYYLTEIEAAQAYNKVIIDNNLEYYILN